MSDGYIAGSLRKMAVELCEGQASYALLTDSDKLPLNDYLGASLKITYKSLINCIHCGRKSSKSFNQGYCYPCFKSLARCDQCIVSPEKCHFHLGTCREPDWAQQFCMQDHIVYLANTSGLKVGITRVDQLPTRWIDQGAVAAIPMYRVSSRRNSGLIEQACKAHVADKTNWRAMLKGDPEPVDLVEERARMQSLIAEEVDYLQSEEGLAAVQEVSDVEATQIQYPVEQYLEKISSHNLDKNPLVEGELQGIKGQYLLLSTGVINLRKYTGYQVEISLAR